VIFTIIYYWRVIATYFFHVCDSKPMLLIMSNFGTISSNPRHYLAYLVTWHAVGIAKSILKVIISDRCNIYNNCDALMCVFVNFLHLFSIYLSFITSSAYHIHHTTSSYLFLPQCIHSKCTEKDCLPWIFLLWSNLNHLLFLITVRPPQPFIQFFFTRSLIHFLSFFPHNNPFLAHNFTNPSQSTFLPTPSQGDGLQWFLFLTLLYFPLSFKPFRNRRVLFEQPIWWQLIRQPWFTKAKVVLVQKS